MVRAPRPSSRATSVTALWRPIAGSSTSTFCKMPCLTRAFAFTASGSASNHVQASSRPMRSGSLGARSDRISWWRARTGRSCQLYSQPPPRPARRRTIPACARQPSRSAIAATPRAVVGMSGSPAAAISSALHQSRSGAVEVIPAPPHAPDRSIPEVRRQNARQSAASQPSAPAPRGRSAP